MICKWEDIVGRNVWVHELHRLRYKMFKKSFSVRKSRIWFVVLIPLSIKENIVLIQNISKFNVFGTLRI